MARRNTYLLISTETRVSASQHTRAGASEKSYKQMQNQHIPAGIGAPDKIISLLCVSYTKSVFTKVAGNKVTG